MKNRAPAFQFYPRQFAGDDQVMGMDLEAIGAHILLMCAAAASPERCRIDAEEYAIRMRLRNPSDEAWQRIKKQLLAGAWKVSPDGRWWIQSGLERTFQKQKDFSEQQRKKANLLWDRRNANVMPESCRSDAESTPEGMPKVCSSSSTSSSNLKPSVSNSNECQSDAEPMPEGLNSMSVAQIICQQNGWSGRQLLWAVKDAIEFQSKKMPEDTLEQVGEWLAQAYRAHQSSKGKFAVGPLKFFSEGLYQPSEPSPSQKTNVLTDNPATRALAQMESD
jgi:hypothetical protein